MNIHYYEYRRLPYVAVATAGGCEVFDRDYDSLGTLPISPAALPGVAAPDARQRFYLYGDAKSPRYDRQTRARLFALLEQFPALAQKVARGHE